MNIKEYFENAYRIDHRINSKFEQLASYNALATRASSTLSGLPGGGTKNVHRMENIIIKIADLEKEICEQIEELVVIKTNITHMIEKLDKPEQRLVLELRYLCMKSWEQISVELGYNNRHVRRMRDEAVCELEKIMKRL